MRGPSASRGRLRIVLPVYPPANGWDQVTEFGRLAARVLGAELVEIDERVQASTTRRMLSILPRISGKDVTIVIAPQPAHLYAAAWPLSRLRGRLVGWVVDSFWTERIPRIARHGLYDQLAVFDSGSISEWEGATGAEVRAIPWGSNVLELGSANTERGIDLQRIGRQAPLYDDDELLGRECAARGMRFSGRPAFAQTAPDTMRTVLDAQSEAKYTLAFSNRVSPAKYTHSSREYLTGRFLDILASGSTVAGRLPRCADSDRLVWEGANVDLPHDDLGLGLDRLAEHVANWTPELALRNHRSALQRLDWRWRFLELADWLDIQSESLDRELEKLQHALAV